MTKQEALNKAAQEAGYADFKEINEAKDISSAYDTDFENIIHRAMDIYAGAKVNEAITDWELANKKANKTLDKLRFTDQYNAAYNQAIRDAADNAKMKFHDGFHKENKDIEHFQSGQDNLTVSKQSILKLLK